MKNKQINLASIMQLGQEDMVKIEPLFRGWDETLLWSCIQGHMGYAWADDIEKPTAAEILLGDFFYFAGDHNAAGAEQLVGNIPEDYRTSWEPLLVPQNEDWASVIERVYAGRFTRLTRYAMKKAPTIFDPKKLQSYIDALPKDYTIRQIDEELYHQAVREEFSKDFCSQFKDCDDFMKRGLGYMILYNGKPVAGASSYSVFTEGIEVEFVTKEEHRRKGLGIAAASRLILECLDRELYPSWDAANLQSRRIAEKLGYEFEREYPTYAIRDYR